MASTAPEASGAGDPVEEWVLRLSEPGALQLPSDHDTKNVKQYAESQELFELSAETCNAILMLSMKRPEARPFTVVLSSFAVVLHKFTREEKVVVGSATSNQLSALRVDVNGNSTLEEVLSNGIAAETEAETKIVNMAEVAMRLHPNMTRAVALSKLFQVCVLNGTDAAASAEIKSTVREEWTLFIETIPDAKKLLPLQLRLVFNALKYSRSRMKDVLRQVELIIKEMTGVGIDKKVKDISIVTPGNKQVFSDPCAVLDDTWEGPIGTKLQAAAESHPERPLIVHKANVYTYKQVNDLSNRVANYLIANGIEKGERVAMYSHRSSALVVGIMGILKAGATFTVIDPAYPVDRQIIYLRVAQPRGIVRMEEAGPLKTEVETYINDNLAIKCHIPTLSMTPSDVLAAVSTDAPSVDIGPDDIGTLSFTSGSTGLPKAVLGRHVSLTHFYPWMSQEFGMNSSDRFSMLSGIAHDPIQRDVFTPIFMGASIHIPDAEDIGNPGALAEWVKEYEVSVVHLTPAMGQLLTANAVARMPSLKVALFVGDVLTKRDVKRLQRLAPNVATVNMYGTTETQRAVSFLKVQNDHSIEAFKEILPSGKGMKDVQLLVLNEAGLLTGHGELGEIYVRSPHLSAGYLGLPEATEAKFLVNPFTKEPRDRMYRSGDLGRFRSNGSVECIGRADDQIKIRGFRIELGEIDTHLGQHKHVRINKTLVMRDANEEKQIISFFVPQTEEYSIEAIRKHLKNKLPSYAVPTVLCPIKKMPLTPNGKVDTRRLPYPDAAIVMAQRKHNDTDDTELSPLGKRIQEIFSQVLGRSVHPNDDFFDVGGHSVLATKLTFTLREELLTPFPLNLLYQYPSVSQLTDVLQQSLDDPTADVAEANAEACHDDVDYEKELVLDASITGDGKAVAKSVNGIFLTGGTGFLGAFLVVDLLKQFPQAVLRCLIRSASDSEAFVRIEKNLTNHQLWNESYAGRIVPVVGDLGKPRFGLSEEQFTTLANNTDLIYHSGALVHWVYPYAQMKAVNVSATIACLRLACIGSTLAPVNFVSSTSIFDSATYMESPKAVLETDALRGFGGLSVGYAQTKFVAEELIRIAMGRGVPAVIFRPGYITGHSQTGVTNLDDYLMRLIKGCIQLKKAPSMRNTLNACPVDFVSRAIVHIGAQAQSIGQTFHFYPPTPVRFSDFFESTKKFGYEVEFVDYMEWRDALMKLTLSNAKTNALYPLMHFVLDDLPSASRTPVLDTTNLTKALEGTGIECTSVSSVMGIYLTYLRKVGFLSNPDGGDDDTEVASDLGRNNRLTAAI